MTNHKLLIIYSIITGAGIQFALPIIGIPGIIGLLYITFTSIDANK